MVFPVLSFSSHPLTVGAITDAKALAGNFGTESADLVELRLDALGSGQAVIDFAQRHHGQIPLLITARTPEEGGANQLAFEKRLELLQILLPYAAAVDVEVAQAEAYSDFLGEARANGTKVVLSSHDFVGFDHVATLERLSLAQSAGADVAKAAVTLRDPVDLTLFESLVAGLGEVPFSLMGMGAYGPISRILAAQHGSLLNYGFLGDEPTAPGQWPARLLKEVIANTPAIAVKN
ncbi:3-dehydroquinate dehydratase [Roseibacillus persicicus]|uniref:3-dehydroquinate dehydratase n=1 Tax=Roseibacillus persicicus TaxID=454148 RepID=A0A918TDL9_9BACT|nr:3-dehydroquinate dehydratase [Roseibacillus persicicus]